MLKLSPGPKGRIVVFSLASLWSGLSLLALIQGSSHIWTILGQIFTLKFFLSHDDPDTWRVKIFPVVGNERLSYQLTMRDLQGWFAFAHKYHKAQRHLLGESTSGLIMQQASTGMIDCKA